MSYLALTKVLDNSKIRTYINSYLLYINTKKVDCQRRIMEDYIENDKGNIFELIAEECYYDDLREE